MEFLAEDIALGDGVEEIDARSYRQNICWGKLQENAGISANDHFRVSIVNCNICKKMVAWHNGLICASQYYAFEEFYHISKDIQL